MPIHLIPVQATEEQFNERSFSVVLGAFQAENHIENFLKFIYSLCHVDDVLLSFHHESYLWHYTNKGLQAHINLDMQQKHCFEHTEVLSEQHVDGQAFSDHLQSLGLHHQSFVALNLKINEESLGYVLLLNQDVMNINMAMLEAIQAFAASLMKILEQHAETLLLKELCEHETSINFSKTKYLQILAHDLRAPFHGLLGFTDVLVHERDTLNDHEIQQIVEYLNDTTQSTYELLESVLNWAMADGGRFAYHPINFKLCDCACIVTDVLKGLAQKKNIELINQVPESIHVFADINMITSVIQNLVSNALKFTNADSHGVVRISAEAENDQVHIYIQDTGLGMTQAQIENLFEPKLTVSIKGTDGESGAGLGLVLCKRFVDLNLGKISVSSKEKEGATFKVSLPASVVKTSKALNSSVA